MNVRQQILILLDEYASGERPQNEVADDIVLIVNQEHQKTWEKGYNDGWADGYDEGIEH